MSASLREGVRPGHRQWNEESTADGNVLVASCRQLANSGTAQPDPPDDVHPSAARFCSAPSPLPSSPPPAHCQPSGGAHGEQPDEPGPAALHDGDDPPQPHRDQEQADAASQQAAGQRTPRIAHHHHLLEDCELGTCLAMADSSRYLLAGTVSAVISVVTTGRASRCRLHRLRPLRCRGRCLGVCLVCPLAVARHGKAGDADI